QLLPDIGTRRLMGGWTFQVGRRHRFLGLRVDHDTLVLQVHVAFGAGVNEFRVEAGGGSGKSGEIVLGPLLERMIVTASAFEAHTKKGLADVRGDITGIEFAGNEVEIGGRIVIEVALADQQFGDNAVVWPVFQNGLPNPVVKDLGPLVATFVEPEAKQVAEVSGPKVGALGPVEEAV